MCAMTCGLAAVGSLPGPCPTPCRGLAPRSLSGSVPGSPRQRCEAHSSPLNAQGLLLFHGPHRARAPEAPAQRGQLAWRAAPPASSERAGPVVDRPTTTE
uniref:Uncharacterized protein n=1 Tax=Alexandrium monilatum TaxID=311494 RepID=A0A7S4WBB6_9DINO